MRPIVDQRHNIIKPVKGTMKLLAVFGAESGNSVWVRNTSCACYYCFKGGSFNVTSGCIWEKQTILEKKTNTDHADDSTIEAREEVISVEIIKDGQDQQNETHKEVEKSRVDKSITVGQFLIAQYEGKRYIGQPSEFDDDDNTIHVNFMTNIGKCTDWFKWPTKEDKIWIEPDDVIKIIDAPKPPGKSNSIFSIPNDILAVIND